MIRGMVAVAFIASSTMQIACSQDLDALVSGLADDLRDEQFISADSYASLQRLKLSERIDHALPVLALSRPSDEYAFLASIVATEGLVLPQYIRASDIRNSISAESMSKSILHACMKDATFMRRYLAFVMWSRMFVVDSRTLPGQGQCIQAVIDDIESHTSLESEPITTRFFHYDSLRVILLCEVLGIRRPHELGSVTDLRQEVARVKQAFSPKRLAEMTPRADGLGWLFTPGDREASIGLVPLELPTSPTDKWSEKVGMKLLHELHLHTTDAPLQVDGFYLR
ncbi:hypothetical protein [Stieleria varia]|uniref:Uncharacterized protein n=1 Tax=Stieleria varia TaxID=2528005 RepID=A0A5C6ATU1_9BACT|nr:hypothetical protein [Stieleria varia]TWU02486.1 hypothetical protein Pla52n_35360 [Stieleria varia]